jgi:predicted flap endonuclease-1-like 5' DNA nuclease/outer membrane murein-binding lipoprotein Lpp
MFQQNVTMAPGTETFSSHLVEIIIMLLGAAILGYILGRVFKKSYRQEFLDLDELHAKCAGIENGLKNTIADLTAKLAALENDLASCKKRFADLTGEYNASLAVNTQLTTQVADLKNTIATLEKDISLHKQNITSLTDKHSVVLADKGLLDKQVATLSAELAKLKSMPMSSGLASQFNASLAKEVFEKPVKLDDLKIVEGIGPKIEELFQKAGIKTWVQLSAAAPAALKAILDSAGPSFQMHDPATWPQQAGMASKNQWKELKELQDKLQGGKA